MFSSSEDGRLEPGEHEARALGRITFGLVLLAGAAIFVERVLADHRDAHAAKLLGATWTISLVAGFVVRMLAGVAKQPPSDRLRVLSFVLPAFATALVLPLTLHLPVMLGLGFQLQDFDRWALVSLYITAPTHVVFATLVAIRAGQLATGRDAISTRRIYVTTVIVASIPFALLWFIPPLLVGFTGLAIVPLLDRMPHIIQRDGAVAVPTAIVRVA